MHLTREEFISEYHRVWECHQNDKSTHWAVVRDLAEITGKSMHEIDYDISKWITPISSQCKICNGTGLREMTYCCECQIKRGR